MKRAKREEERIHTYLGRVIRDFERKTESITLDRESQFLLEIVKSVFNQKRDDSKKIYSIHVLHVECIFKGKAHNTIKRAYFWKPGVKGISSLDAELNLPTRIHSYLLDKWVQQRITEEPYQEAINSIGNLFHLKLTKQISQKITVESSQDVENFYKGKSIFPDEGSDIIIQVDCKGIIMVPRERPETKFNEEFTRRAKGVSKIGTKKDSVVTADYSINPSKRTAKYVLDGLMSINSNKKKKKKNSSIGKKSNPINKQVVATMEGKEKAFLMLLDRVKARDLTEKKPIFILIDGAVSLEKGLLK